MKLEKIQIWIFLRCSFWENLAIYSYIIYSCRIYIGETISSSAQNQNTISTFFDKIDFLGFHAGDWCIIYSCKTYIEETINTWAQVKIHF